MPLRLNLSKLTGNPGGAGWCQVHEFKPEDAEKLKLRGHFFAVISTRTSENSFDSVVVGREIISRLHEEYFGNLKDSAFNTLNGSVKKVYTEFKESLGGVQIIALATFDNLVYSVAVGGATLAILRDGILGKLLIGPDGSPVGISGKAEEKDMLVAGTNTFFQAFPEGVIKANLKLADLESVAESFAPTVHSLGNGDIGALFIRFGEEEFLNEKRDVGFELIDTYKRKVNVPPAESSEEVMSLYDEKPEQQNESVYKQSPDFSSSTNQNVKGRLPQLNIPSFPKLGFVSKILQKIPRRSLKVGGEEENFEVKRRKKVSATVGLILIVLLVVSIVFGVKQRSTNVQRSKYQDKLAEAQHDMDEAVSLFSVSPDRARQLFSQSRDIVSNLLSEGVKDPNLDTLRQQLANNEGNILGEYREDANLFIDLSLLTNNFVGDRIVASNDIAYILDSNLKRVVSVSIDNKRTEVVAGPGIIEEAKEIAANMGNVYILNSKGLFEVDNGLKKALDKDWSDNSIIYTYSSNLYLLDKGNSTISRYSGTDSGFGGKVNWLKSSGFDFSNVAYWSIDTSIWILDGKGKIYKFTSGNQQNFQVTGMSQPLSNPKAIYTNEDDKNLYVLDSDNLRVVVLDKNGGYVAQYISDKVKGAIGLVVSEKLGKIILLGGGKLYSLDLKS